MPHDGDTLYLIDGHAQIFRAYFAIRGGMNSPVTGEPTHAVFGFAGMLLKLFNSLRPRYVVVAVDSPGKTFRDELYDQYKANRPPAPADLHAQEHRIFELIRLLGIPLLAQPGAEADDIIATVTRRVLDDARRHDVNIRIVSRDKDLEQLLGDRVTMFDIHTDTTIDARWLLDNKGITPQQVVDLLTLTGDTADNVPGVPGVGPKTAASLIQEFGSIEGIYQHLDQIKGKRRENLEAARDRIPLSRQLVRLKDDLVLDFDLDRARVGPIDAAGLRKLFADLGLRRHEPDLNRLINARAESAAPVVRETRPAADVPASGPDSQGMLFASSLFDAPAVPTSDAGSAVTPAVVAVPEGLTSAHQGDYHAITTRAQLDDLITTLGQQNLIALDTETIGLGHRAVVCGLSLAWKPGHAVYIPLRSPDPASHLPAHEALDALRPLLESPHPAKTGHNIKYDLLVLRHAGIRVDGVVFDSMIASHLLGMPAHGLDHLALALLKHHMMQISELIGPAPARGQPQATMDQVPLDRITRYAADDAEVSLRLEHELTKQLRTLGMENLARDVEMPLVEVLAEMEFDGIRVDPAVLAEQKSVLARRIDELRDAVHQHVGVPFNLDSPRQLADVLFNQLKLPVQKRTKTGPSTDIEVLEKLAELDDLTREQAAVPELIVEYRQLSKLVGTYLDALRESINPATGRVHARFHQTGAATGRLSSSDPNLQNIPIRTEVGRQIRRAFIAEPGHQLVSADYSQIELRILAHLSQDPALIAAFEADQDIHAAVAAQVFGVPPESVTKDQRNHAKVINFGIIYGVTPYGLARRIDGMDVAGARKLIGDYKLRFAGIDAFLDQCVKQAEDLGYVTTIMERRRPVPQLRAGNAAARSLGERLAINSVVQGSAADLIKVAMVNLHRRIRRENLPLRLLLQIHDELVLETPEDRVAEMSAIVRHEMEHAMSLRVPLKAEAGSGVNWLECK